MSKQLSTNQKKVIAALLTEPNQTAAAAAVGLNVRTIQKYLQEPAFKIALAEAETEAIANAARIMANGAARAVAALADVIDNPEAEPRERIAAASAYLSHLPRVRLLGSIEERLSQAEAGWTSLNDDT